MGVVLRALDPELDRGVALAALPDARTRSAIFADVLGLDGRSTTPSIGQCFYFDQ